MKALAILALGGLLAAALPAAADDPRPPLTHVSGVVAALNGDELDLTAADGSKSAVMLTDKTRLSFSVPITMADVKPGSYIGAGAMGDASGGNLKAMEITVFPESARGAGEGYRPWDQGANSRMTNGTVSQVVGTTSQSITITYKGGQQTVAIPDGTPIVTFAPGDKAALVVGAHVSARTLKGADGVLTAVAVTIGKDGSTPPV